MPTPSDQQHEEEGIRTVNADLVNAESRSRVTKEPETAGKSTIDRRNAFDFHMREHASLRREIELDKQEMRRLELYAVIGTGLVWSWIITSSKPGLQYAWFIPILFSVLGLLKTHGLIKSILIKASYLRNLEQTVLKLEHLQGWENFIEEHRGEYPAWLNWLFWLLLTSATLIVPLLVLVKRLL